MIWFDKPGGSTRREDLLHLGTVNVIFLHEEEQSLQNGQILTK